MKPRRRLLRRRDFFAFLTGLAASAPFAAWMLDPRRARCEPGSGADQRALPLLVFVIPTEPGEQLELGRMLGAYLNFGSDDALAPLAVVEVACVAEDELPAPGTVEGEGPFRLRISRAHTGARSREVCFAPFKRIRDAQSDIATVAAAVHQAILPTGTLEPAWPGLASHSDQSDAIANIHAGMPVAEAALAPIAPALLASALEARGSAREHAMHAVAELVRARLVRGVVPGAEWATSGGCGMSIEGRPPEEQPDRGIACGMGHVPEHSRRFLYFYTRKRYERRR